MIYIEALYHILDFLEDEMGERYLEVLDANMAWNEKKTEENCKRLTECKKLVEEISDDIKIFKELHRKELEES